MAQITSGVRRLLAAAHVYDLFQWLVGADAARATLARDFIRAQPGQRILDIGCGTGAILAHLPAVEYYGFDLSADYIAAARQRFGNRGTFWPERVTSASLERVPQCDIVITVAVLHHLDDDEALQLFGLAHAALRPGGRLVTYDNCYTADQSWLSRWIVSRDRGQNVRWEPEYRALAEKVFARVRTVVSHKILRIPYTSIFMECEK
ncbi:MAG: class I SAM-dependent methyltransferase [Phycisphaerae bacterium]|nr:class I SAM-dependent methyltransferase [Phycisphaerae bacterium]